MAATKGKPEEHAKFMQLLVKYIEHVAASGVGYAVALCANLKRAGRGPLVLEKKTTGHRRHVRMTFVREDTFKALYENTVDAKRFGNLSTDKHNGADTKGYWCKGDFNTDLPAHDLHEFYEDEALEMLDQIGSNDVQLTKNQSLQIFQAEDTHFQDRAF